MLPKIAPEFNLQLNYATFLNDLKNTAFSGEICLDYATRLTMAVDNSIYQVIPQAVIFPRTTDDIAEIFRLAHYAPYHGIQFCPRGGGTSTNGQSLTSGIILDCSKYMREILEINLDELWVRVQPGVILDQLNSYLKLTGYSFAPEISPSNRATIGGMINTDACGMGSRMLGRTSDHVLGLTCVLHDGATLNTENSKDIEIYDGKIRELIAPHTQEVAERFTSAPRTLNGYNLKNAYEQNINYLFCGSEGTLAVITECKLKLTPIPKYKKLVVVKYRNYDDALRAVEITSNFKPLAIEAIDEKLVSLAREDSLYFHIKNFIDTEHQETRAINLVEFVSQDEASLEKTIIDFCAVIEANKTLPQHAIGFYVAQNETEAKLLWELRKKSVGLISKKMDGTRRPIPFIEDTAVPPEKLADYIMEFRALLDSYGLLYGMYGHVDAGCVHVRPALDMKLTNDEKLIPEITEKVVVLIEKYQGVLWGEHGHGYRSDYGRRFFGDTLYEVVRQIKTLFDPYNQLNPGKIATAINTSETLVKISGPLRGQYDRQISAESQTEFANAVVCNGNGACFNYATADVMCPSYKVTKNRVQSPKGRATVIREWLRALSKKNYVLNFTRQTSFITKCLVNLANRKSETDFSHEVFNAMSGCLSCKACASQCPLNVDVPDFKAKFLAVYYQRYIRPLRDFFIAAMEIMAPLLAKFPRISNTFLSILLTQTISRKMLKLTDIPLISRISVSQELEKRNAPVFDLELLKQLSPEQKSKSVIILQDTFSSFYESELLIKIYDAIKSMGFTVYIAPFFPSGKPLHVKGFLGKFDKLVKKNNAYLNELAALNISLVGIDPSITLTYRDEYQKVIKNNAYTIYLLQEWLSKLNLPVLSLKTESKIFYLLSHCTEKTLCVGAEKQWQTIFALFGLKLIPLSAGCCGMAGSYGHEVEHVANSKVLFEMDWARLIAEYPEAILATGYSCRTQAKRFADIRLRHPMEAIGELLAR